MDFRAYSELYHSVSKDVIMDPIDNMSPDQIAEKYTPEQINKLYEKFFTLSTSNSRYLAVDDNLIGRTMKTRLKKLKLAYDISTRQKKKRR